MGILHDIKVLSKNIVFNSSNFFKRKVPIYVPVYKSDLLKNRVAVITGGSSGIGYAIAQSFLESGATVVITGRDKEKVDNALNELKKTSPNIYGTIFDLTKIENIDNFFFDIEKNIVRKKVDILVNNAGTMLAGNIGKTLEKDYDTVMNSNLKGTYFLSQSFANYLINNKTGGNILNISSSSSIRPIVNPYSLSKWGIKGLTIGMAKKYIDHGIIVNAIAPGPTATKMLSENSNNITLLQYPLNRYILPIEVANLAVFMCSDMGKMIVGDTIYMSGGLGIVTVDDINY